LLFSLDHYKKYFGAGLCYNIVFHPYPSNLRGTIYDDKQLTVEIIPLRHSLPVAGFIFREKQRSLNIRKESIKEYSLSIKDIRNIKEGGDHILDSGEIISNSRLTLPPYKPRSYAFCTDTTVFPALITALSNVDMLYFESTFLDADKKLARDTSHSTAAQAASLAERAHTGKLLLGHFSNRYKDIRLFEEEARKVFPESFAVKDGDNYDIPQIRDEVRA
jgi:ribonuclease Z